MPRRKRTAWNEELYRELRKQGYSREKAARIAEQGRDPGQEGDEGRDDRDHGEGAGEYREWTISTGEEPSGGQPFQRSKGRGD